MPRTNKPLSKANPETKAQGATTRPERNKQSVVTEESDSAYNRFNMRLSKRDERDIEVQDILNKLASNKEASDLVKQLVYEYHTGKSWHDKQQPSGIFLTMLARMQGNLPLFLTKENTPSPDGEPSEPETTQNAKVAKPLSEEDRASLFGSLDDLDFLGDPL